MQALIVAVLSLTSVLIGAALQYAFGQRLEARKQLGVQKAQAYIDFFRAVAALGQERSKEQLALAIDAKTRICIYGSTSVIRKLSEFEQAGATATHTSGQTALVGLLEAMREDVTSATPSFQRGDLMLILFGQANK